jgi:hypothetical protein
MDDIENNSLLDHKLVQAYAEVEAAVSAGILRIPGQMGSNPNAIHTTLTMMQLTSLHHHYLQVQ